MSVDATIPNPAASAASSASEPEKLDRVIELLGQLVTPQPSTPIPAVSANVAAAAAPVRPDPEPEPVAEAPQPHPGETFAPGQLAYYTYHRNGEPEGKDRTQVVAVVATTDDHVHGLVLGDAQDVASFAQGQLTHTPPASLT